MTLDLWRMEDHKVTEPSSLDALGFAVDRLRRIEDPADRLRAIRAFSDGLGRTTAELKGIQGEAVLELRAVTPPLSFEEIGDLLGVTRQRAHAIAAEAIFTTEPNTEGTMQS